MFLDCGSHIESEVVDWFLWVSLKHVQGFRRYFAKSHKQIWVKTLSPCLLLGLRLTAAQLHVQFVYSDSYIWNLVWKTNLSGRERAWLWLQQQSRDAMKINTFFNLNVGTKCRRFCFISVAHQPGTLYGINTEEKPTKIFCFLLFSLTASRVLQKK